MRRTFRNGVGELAPKLILPGHYQQRLRDRLADIEEATSALNVECARQRAVGVIEGLELAEAVATASVERLYLLAEEAATVRLQTLEQDSGL